MASRITRSCAHDCRQEPARIRNTDLSVADYLRDLRKILPLTIPLIAALVTSTWAQSPPTPSTVTSNGAASAMSPAAGATLTGTVVDKDGAAIPNATVALKVGLFSAQTVSGGDGTFTFNHVPAGVFELSFSAADFANLHQIGTLQPGQQDILPPVQLVVATNVEVNVTQTREEIAEEEIHVEEKQKVLGVIPNYYVSYNPEAQPLNSRQKLQLGWKFTFNPVMFGIAGIAAGIQQANNTFSGYGQGAQGYAKRFGASYADFATGTILGNVVFPVVFKQDPRYFYKGTGSRKSRFLYALANAVICKGDNGHWQPNYSSVLGSLAAGGISNLYYPAENRNGVGLTFENTLFGIAGSAAAGVVQEFFLRKVTAHAQDPQSSQ